MEEINEDKVVMDYLKSSTKPLSIHEIVSATKLPTNVVSRVIYSKFKEKRLARMPERYFVPKK